MKQKTEKMARLARVGPAGVPQYIIQRGNNHQVCFGVEADMKAYLHCLKEYSKKSQVEIHAWVLMTNHVHLLCTPKKENGTSQMMQSLGVCPRIEAVARESGFESYFFMI